MQQLHQSMYFQYDPLGEHAHPANLILQSKLS